MFAKDFSIQDLERLGPIVEELLQSGKLTDDEKWAVDLSCRAATDLAYIRQSKLAQEFYSRPDVEERSADLIADWLADNVDSKPGTVVLICGKFHVASYGSDGNLNLYPLSEL